MRTLNYSKTLPVTQIGERLAADRWVAKQSKAQDQAHLVLVVRCCSGQLLNIIPRIRAATLVLCVLAGLLGLLDGLLDLGVRLHNRAMVGKARRGKTGMPWHKWANASSESV